MPYLSGLKKISKYLVWERAIFAIVFWKSLEHFCSNWLIRRHESLREHCGVYKKARKWKSSYFLGFNGKNDVPNSFCSFCILMLISVTLLLGPGKIIKLMKLGKCAQVAHVWKLISFWGLKMYRFSRTVVNITNSKRVGATEAVGYQPAESKTRISMF